MIFFKRMLIMSVLLLSATRSTQAMFDKCCVATVEQSEAEQVLALEQELLAGWIEPEFQEVIKLFNKKLFSYDRYRIDSQGERYILDRRMIDTDENPNGFAKAFAKNRIIDDAISKTINSFSHEQCKAILSQRSTVFYDDKVTPFFGAVVSREWAVMLAFGEVMKRLTKGECVEYLNKKFWHEYTVFEFAFRMGRSDSLMLLGLILKNLALSKDQYLAIFRGCKKSIDADGIRFYRKQLSLIKVLGDVVFTLYPEIAKNKKLQESLFFGLLENQYYQRMK